MHLVRFISIILFFKYSLIHSSILLKKKLFNLKLILIVNNFYFTYSFDDETGKVIIRTKFYFLLSKVVAFFFYNFHIEAFS